MRVQLTLPPLFKGWDRWLKGINPGTIVKPPEKYPEVKSWDNDDAWPPEWPRVVHSVERHSIDLWIYTSMTRYQGEVLKVNKAVLDSELESITESAREEHEDWVMQRLSDMLAECIERLETE